MPQTDSPLVPLVYGRQPARFWYRPLLIWLLAFVAAGLSTHHLWLINDHSISDDAYIDSVFANMAGWFVALIALVLGCVWLAVGPRTRRLACSVAGLLIIAVGVFGVLWLSVP